MERLLARRRAWAAWQRAWRLACSTTRQVERQASSRAEDEAQRTAAESIQVSQPPSRRLSRQLTSERHSSSKFGRAPRPQTERATAMATASPSPPPPTVLGDVQPRGSRRLSRQAELTSQEHSSKFGRPPRPQLERVMTSPCSPHAPSTSDDDAKRRLDWESAMGYSIPCASSAANKRDVSLDVVSTTPWQRVMRSRRSPQRP